MKAKYKNLTLNQLDATLNRLEPLKSLSVPQKGWVRAIRDALGMTGQQLAKRLNTTRQRIGRIEQDEKRGRVTLNTLQKTAEAMDCIFVYGLVPRESLQQTIRTQAQRVARKRLSRSNQMMRLEKQELTEAEKQNILDEMSEELISTMPRNLWDE